MKSLTPRSIAQGGIYFFLVLLLASLPLLSNQAWSKTPDGKTPAEELTCVGLSGAAFGLCNAFCEAQDCNIMDPSDWGKSCHELLGNYQEETGVGGPPCFCGGGCALEFDACLDACADDDDPCCEIDCRNASSQCNFRCCFQNCRVSTARCIARCDGDPDCIDLCISPCFCGVMHELCIEEES